MWNTFIYEPLYNAFVYILSITPNTNIALAITIFTILVKIVLFPLYKKSIKGQLLAKKIAPELKAIQEKYKDDRQEMSKQTMDLYKKHGANPFSALLLIIIQIPILLALYFVFKDGVARHTEHLYSFVQFPEGVSTLMLGFIDVTKAFIPLSLLVGITQAVQARISFSNNTFGGDSSDKKSDTPSFQEEFAKTMRIQVLYVLPVIITVVSLGFPSAIALYWVVSNLCSIVQELYVKKSFIV